MTRSPLLEARVSGKLENYRVCFDFHCQEEKRDGNLKNVEEGCFRQHKRGFL